MREPLTRTFVAVELSAEVREAVAAVQQRLRAAGAGLRWVAPQHLHLTLRFLGEIAAGQVEGAKAAARAAASGVEPFEVTFRSVGAFPSARRPQAVWIGVDRGARELEALASALDGALRTRGFGPPDRPFRAHLTIGRARAGADPGRVAGALGPLDAVAVGTQAVSRIVVMASLLGSGGPTYTVLDEAPLKGSVGGSKN